ncbi:MAG TPA: MFS transporter [Blastocatellia bacterium]|nr:MFS transporter [Blastocatellia bacterium]
MLDAGISSHRKSDRGQVRVAAHVGFVLTGAVTTLLGPVLPALTAKWSLTDSEAGYLFTAQFIGAVAGSTALAAIIARAGFLRSLALGFVLMAAGVAGLAAGAWTLGLASVFFYGMGFGITIPATNLLISEINPRRRAAALNIVNFAWCLGAVASPPIIALFVNRYSLNAALFGLALLSGAVAVWIVRRRLTIGVSKQSGDGVEIRSAFWSDPVALLVAALLFLYVGTENAIGGWVASYASRLKDGGGVLWAMGTSIFWGALMAGRAGAPLLLRRVSEGKLVLGALVLAAAGVSCLLAATGMVTLMIGVALSGAGLACVYPTTWAVFSEYLGARASEKAGIISAMGGLGGATLPWAVGVASTRFGSLRSGLLIALLSSLVMIALQVSIILTLARRNADAKTAKAA